MPVIAIIASIVGCMFVKTTDGGKIMGALYRGLIVAGVLALVAYYPVTAWLIGAGRLDAEQLFLHPFWRNRRRIDHHKRPFNACGRIVQGTRGQFLAGA